MIFELWNVNNLYIFSGTVFDCVRRDYLCNTCWVVYIGRSLLGLFLPSIPLSMPALNVSKDCTYLVAIKDKSLFIRAQFLVRQASWSGPANPHLSSGHYLKLKVPLPHVHTVRLLSTEDTKPLR